MLLHDQDDMVAKIADLGLSRYFVKDRDICTHHGCGVLLHNS